MLESPLLSLLRCEVGTLVRINNVWEDKRNKDKFIQERTYLFWRRILGRSCQKELCSYQLLWQYYLKAKHEGSVRQWIQFSSQRMASLPGEYVPIQIAFHCLVWKQSSIIYHNSSYCKKRRETLQVINVRFSSDPAVVRAHLASC